jgi:hypothetical protein
MRKSIFSSTDLQFLFTFMAGMGGFWLSGHLPGYLPQGVLPRNAIVGLIIALVIYGLAMLLWSALILGRGRNLRAVIVAAVIAMALALATSLALPHLPFGRPHDKTGLAIWVFGLYLVYGLYFVIGWAASRRLARAHA